MPRLKEGAASLSMKFNALEWKQRSSSSPTSLRSSPTFRSRARARAGNEAKEPFAALFIWNASTRCVRYPVYGIHPTERALKRAIHVMAIAMHDAGVVARRRSLSLSLSLAPSMHARFLVLYLERVSAYGVHYSTCGYAQNRMPAAVPREPR